MSTEVNLLIIDDDDINIFIMSKMIKKTGYNVSMVSELNGQLGIDYLSQLIDQEQNLPNLILVDINMPVLNGWDFLDSFEKLKIKKDVDMYLLSSSVYDNDMEKAKTYKTVKGFISKPISIDQLIQLFEKAISEPIGF